MGITLFCLVFGLLPFPCPDGDILQLFASIMCDPPRFPRLPSDSGSEEVVAVVNLIESILQKEPAKRPNLRQIRVPLNSS